MSAAGTDDDGTLRSSRTAVTVLFVLAGTVMGSWAGRIPSVREQIGVGDGMWGLIILAAPIGSLLSLITVTRLVTVTGARRLAVPGAVGLLVLAPISALSVNAGMLAVCLFVQGLSQGLLFSPMNALAVRVERAYRRSILSSFHGWFSIGQLTGGLLGVLAGALLLAPSLQLAVGNVVLAGLLLATARSLPDDRPTGPPVRTAKTSRTSVLTRQLVLLAAIGFLSGVNEGAATQWSALYSVSAGASIAVGSLTLVCFSLAIAAVRLRGDRLVQRWGQIRFLQASGLFAALGMATALSIGTVPAALAGFAALGLGSGCIVPVVTSLAGNQPDVPSARGVALASLGSWPAFLLGPPVIGFLAEAVGLRWGLGVIVVSALGISLLAGRVRVAPGR